MKQTVGNACGTIALLHAFGNRDYTVVTPTPDAAAPPPPTAATSATAATPSADLLLSKGSFLVDFFAKTRGMDAEARGKYLEDPPEGELNIESVSK